MIEYFILLDRTNNGKIVVSVKGTDAFRVLNRSEKMDSKDILADLRGLKST